MLAAQERKVPDRKLFGARIRELREAKSQDDSNFTLRMFAQALGLSAAFLSRMERGKESPPKAENIKRMAELLSCDADELLALGGKVDPELERIIKEHPQSVPHLLRAVRGMPSDQMQLIKDFAEFKKNQQ